MSLVKMAIRGLRQHALASALTAASLALGTALTVAVLLLAQRARGAFEETAFGVQILVAGNKGSRVDALLGTLYHTGRAPGRVALAYVDELKADRRVDYAIPFAVGDRVRGLPLVGTTGDLLDHFEPRPGESFVLDGRRFDAGPRYAVAGAATGFSIGDRFAPSHGGVEGDRTHEHEVFEVVGTLASTGTAHDRAVWVNLPDFLHLKGHSGMERGAGEVDAVSAVLVKAKSNSPAVLEPLIRDINDGTEAQAIRPMLVVAELLALFGTARVVLQWVSWLVIGVAVVSVAVALYNAMAARGREIALLRGLGMPRRALVTVILMESVVLCVGGALAGLALGHVAAAVAAPWVEAAAGVRFEHGLLLPDEPLILLAMAVAGAIAGALPAVRAYRVDVARSL
ncbi:MAG: FtsX-like permease family protein [Planctomycetota bacterium]|jgi:putative ABC transport system permease protein